MKKIEKAPDWNRKDLIKQSLHLLIDKESKLLIDKINDKYLYWTKIKNHIATKKTDPKILWTAIKLSRMLNVKLLTFGKYIFNYNLTNYMQKELHNLDLHIGGQLSAKNLILPDDKERYLISSIMEEAIASSQIEGAITTRKNAKIMLKKGTSPKTKSEQMIVNNYLTIKQIVEIQNEDITKEKLLQIHKLITNRTLDDSKDEGTLRKNNEIKVIDATDGKVAHIPPNYTELPELLSQLFRFFNKQENQFVHPIVKACIIHFMVGFIHPFVDGNGRVARALFYWYLLKNGYWLTEYLSISRLIVKSKTQYAKAFKYTEIDENDLSYFITYNIKTTVLAFESLKEYIQRKINEKKQYLHFQKIKDINERQALILKWINDEPDILLTVKEIENRLNVSNQTGRNDLLKLVEKQYLQLIEIDKKSKAFCKNNNFDKILKKELKRIK